MWRSITSASSWPLTGGMAARPRIGCDSWHPGDGRRWSSVASAMTTSTPVGHCDAGRNEWLESRMMRKVSCPVRRGADGKGPGHRNLASRLPYNLIAQLKSGVHALAAPVDDLVSNWAYMVMASLAWSLKAWGALLVPVSPRHAEAHRAESRAWLR